MIPQQFLDRIENPTYGMELGLVSTPRQFDKALKTEPNARKLLAVLHDPHERFFLQNHICSLLELKVDERYAHPKDLAIAVYLRMFELLDPDSAITAAIRAKDMPSLWWSRAIAHRILDAAKTRTHNIEFTQLIVSTQPVKSVVHSSATAEVAISEMQADNGDVEHSTVTDAEITDHCFARYWSTTSADSRSQAA